MKFTKRIFSKNVVVVALVLLVAIFLSKFPSIHHYLNQPQGFWFVGHAEWFDQKDINTYISHIITAQSEGLFITNRYTLIEHTGAFIFQPYALLGILNRFLQLNPIFLFHISTIISSFLLIFSCYFLTKLIFKNFLIRSSAFITIVLGGGIGWLSPKTYPIDLYGAGFTLINALERSHDALSTFFLILSICFVILFTKSNKNKYIFLAATSAFLQTIIHPPFILLYTSAYLIFAIYIYFKNHNTKFFLLPFLLCIFFGLYYLNFLFDLMKNPGYASIVNQNLWSVNPIQIFLGFGFFTPLIILAILKNKTLEGILLSIFFLLQIVLLFTPLGFNLYFLKGLFIWGIILAFVGINYLKIKKIYLYFLIVVLVFTSFFSRIYIFNELINVNKYNKLYFLSTGDKHALNYLNTLPDNSRILSMYYLGNAIPAHTKHRVYISHLGITPDSDRKILQTQRFFTEMTKSEQASFINATQIEYIYYGTEEATARKELNLKIKNPFPYFQKVYSNRKVIIYKTNIE